MDYQTEPASKTATATDIEAVSPTICNNTTTNLSASVVPMGVSNPVFRWYTSQNATEYIAEGATFTTPTLTATTSYYVSFYKDNEYCENLPNDRKQVTVTVNAILKGGDINHDQTICSNTKPAKFVSPTPASGETGNYTYQWQYSTNKSNWTTVANTNSIEYAHNTALTQTTYFRRKVTDNTCTSTAFSDTVTVTVRPDLNPGNIGSNQTICAGEIPTPLTSSASASGGTSSFTYKWQDSTASKQWKDISGATLTTYSPPALTTTTHYRRQVIDNTCGTKNSNTVTVTVKPLPTLTSETTPSAICSGTTFNYTAQSSINGTTFTWKRGIVYGILEDAKTGQNTNPINETLTNTTTSTVNVKYEIELTFDGCKKTYEVTASVYGRQTGGTITASQTICYNAKPTTLSSTAAAGGNGTYNYKWQDSTAGKQWEDISDATSSTYSPPALTVTTHYRRLATNNCGTIASNTVTVTVRPDLDGGTIAAVKTSICNTAQLEINSTKLASGGYGTINYQWEYYDGTEWTNLSQATSPTYKSTSPQTAASTQYRRRATDQTCQTSAYSNTITITVYPAINGGIISATKSPICNNAPSTLNSTTSASGGDGDWSYTWQDSTASTQWTTIPGATSATYASSVNLTTTTHYRRLAHNACGTTHSNTATVTVREQLDAGKLIPDQTICNNTTPGELSQTAPSGGANLTYKWQQSIDGTSWTDIGITTATHIPGNLVASTHYRRIVTSDNNCGADTTTTLKITIHPTLNPGTIANLEQTICYNAIPATITATTASGGDGSYTYDWQYSTNNGQQWHYIANSNTRDYTPSIAPTETTQYRRMVTDGCSNINFTIPMTVIVRSSSLYEYPDLRIRACPDAGTTISLSKYIDTLDVTDIQWSSPLDNAGQIPAEFITGTYIQTLTYTITNPCHSVTRKIYLETLQPNRRRPLRDTIEICYKEAKAVQINQIFGIETGGGTWNYQSQSTGDVDTYITESQSPSYKGAVIMDGQSIYNSPLINYYPYRGMTDTKKVEFTYTPSKSSCLSGETFKVVIILIK
jgi:hypothetical protein